MLTLYARTTCPYCVKVLKAGEEMNIAFDLKDVTDPAVMRELVEKGGKRQMPFLIDSERNVSLYESEDIIEYLRAHYGTNAPTL